MREIAVTRGRVGAGSCEWIKYRGLNHRAVATGPVVGPHQIATMQGGGGLLACIDDDKCHVKSS